MCTLSIAYVLSELSASASVSLYTFRYGGEFETYPKIWVIPVREAISV
jgi:hypothetical protein